MAIDGRMDAVEKQYPEPADSPMLALVPTAVELALPHTSIFLKFAELIKGHFSAKERQEVGYSVCARLQGFGLAHEIRVSAREVPIGDYCFRPSQRGLMLLNVLGDNVPNWEHYFPTQSGVSSGS